MGFFRSDISDRIPLMDAETTSTAFTFCIHASAKEDLEAGNVYRVIVDAKAEQAGCLRVIDESGEDYLYPAARFVVRPSADNR